jgi:hypothetical protein
MGEEKIDHEHEIGGFNPERPKERKKDQVGPAPTDDPRRAAASDLKDKIKKTPAQE